MKKLLFIWIALLVFTNGNSQILDPVKWTSKIEKKSEKSYLLTFQAIIEKDWHLYSQFTADGGSLPLELELPVGIVTEPSELVVTPPLPKSCGLVKLSTA